LEINVETDVRVDFHGTEPRETFRQRILEQVSALAKFFGRITACHVGIRAPSHRHRTGGLYRIEIHLVLPDGREVAVGRTPRKDERHSDPLFAINDAFRRARRRLQDKVRKMEGKTKTHTEQPTGTVKRLSQTKGFGFIRADDGHEIYFHRNSVIGGGFPKLRRGARVSFVEEVGENGPQASTVRSLEKHHMRVAKS
jgi:cold shock CspA family protein